MANDTPIEFGPGIHGLDEITYLYVREPGGFRIEINAGRLGQHDAGLAGHQLEPVAGRHDVLEERGDARVDDGMLAGREGRRGAARPPRDLSQPSCSSRASERRSGAHRQSAESREARVPAIVSADGESVRVLDPALGVLDAARQPRIRSGSRAGAPGAAARVRCGCWRRSIRPRSATSRSSSSTSKGSSRAATRRALCPRAGTGHRSATSPTRAR